MKKRIYRALPVKDFNWSRLSVDVRELKLNRLVLGVDVAKQEMYGSLMLDREEILGLFKWDHLKETRAVISHLMGLGVATLEVAMEPSGTYGDALRECFRSSGAQIFKVHPKQVKDGHEIYDGVPSQHDAKCSGVVGWLHLLGCSEVWLEEDPDRLALASALQLQDLHQDAFQQGQNRLEARLARHWPELLDLLELSSASLLELLSCYGSAEQVAAAESNARTLLQKASHRALSEKKISQILTSAHQSLGVKAHPFEVKALQELAQETRRRQQALHTAQKRVRALVRQKSTTAQVGEAVGLLTAGVLYQGLGALEDYPNAGSLLKAAGLNLKERSSGRHQGQLGLTKRGPRRARQFLFLATLRWIKKDPWVRAWHRLKCQRDGGLKMKSVIALMRKLLKGLWWVARGHTLDTTKLFDTQRLIAAGAVDADLAIAA